MIKAVLFDLDGTLVNSLRDLAGSSNYALSCFGYPVHPEESYKIFVGDGMIKLMERILPTENRDGETVQKLFESFWAHYSKHYTDFTTPYDGIIELVSELKKMGLKVAVISNKAEKMAVAVVDKIFGNTFDLIYGKCDGFPTKPDPTLTLKLIDELGVKPQECLLVGDSGMDVATAVNVGCKGIGVLWGFRSREELLANGASYIAEKPQDIIRILKEIDNEI